MKGLEVYFRLIDKASAPARRVERAMRGVAKAAKKVDATTAGYRALRREFGLSERSARTLATALRGVAYARGAVASATTSMAYRFGRLASAFGAATRTAFNFRTAILAIGSAWVASGLGRNILEAMTFKESQLATLRLRLGPEGAAQFFERAMRVSDITPYDPTVVIEAYKSLLTANLNPREVESVFWAISDLVATSGRSFREVMPRAILAIRQILAKPALQKEELNQLAESVNLGLGDFYRVLGKHLERLTGKKWTNAQIEKAISAGRISGRLGVAAILDYVRTYVDQGKALGEATKRQSQTIGGLLSTLAGYPKRWFMSLVPSTKEEEEKLLAQFAGYRSLKGFLQNLAKVFNPSSELGAKLLARVRQFFNGIFARVFGALGGNLDAESFARRVGALFDRLEVFADRASRAFAIAKRYAADFLAGFKDALAGLKAAWNSIKPVVGWLGRLTGGFQAASVAGGGTGETAARLAGLLAGLAAVWRIANLVTLGGAGALVRWAAMATASAIPAIGRMIAGLLRMGAAWIVGLGPVFWIGAAVVAAVAAIVYLVVRYWDDIKAAFSAAWDWITGLWGGFTDWISRVFDEAMTALRALPERFAALAASIWEGFVGGLQRMFDATKDRIMGFFTAPIDWAKKALGIHSPSRVFEHLGRMSVLGYERGLRSLPKVAAAAVPAVTLAAAPVPARAAAAPAAQVVVHVHEGAVRVEADGEPNAIARAVRDELIRLAMEVGHA